MDNDSIKLDQDEISNAINLGIEWLLTKQRDNGCWGEDAPWLTGSVLRTLGHARNIGIPIEKTDDLSQCIADGITFLSTKKGPDGSWDRELGLWDTAIILRGLVQCEEKNISIDARKYLKSRGSDYFSDAHPYGSSYPAQYLTAIIESSSQTQDDLGTFEWLIREIIQQQHEENGSWNNDFFNTGESLEAFDITINRIDKITQDKVLQMGVKNGIQNAVTWLQINQGPYGLWGGLTWTHSVALNAYLQAIKKIDAKAVDAIKWLLGEQHPNGSWFHLPDHTTFAVFALITTNKFLSL